jgi:3-methyl-2-oxobutanoate hydroxymethyltransferase
MIYHAKSVSRGAERAFLVGDMPFGSYEGDKKKAVNNAIRFLKEGNSFLS